jgi:uncharacterized protein YjgD (DUF1641 family)
MAEPITNIKRMEMSEETIKQHNLTEVLDAVSSNKKTILEGIDLLISLHESGALEMLNALIKQKDEALKNVVEQANKPAYATIIENLSDLFLLIGELPVDDLQHFIGKFNNGFKEARLSENKIDTSLMDLLKALKNPEVNRSVSMLFGFLQGMGRK